jgi:alkanesulfonate monooxygenase SsuD/methylene tetrahydromethanopterin reductase-like flavin-dependent oxidoreductase (luciferase family)
MARTGIRFGAQLWPQTTDWPSFRDAAIAADAAGWDSIWTRDHLVATSTRGDEPILEAWSLLTATAAVTSRVRLGAMVAANEFRHPAISAKLAATLDEISGGRAILGIGAGSDLADHESFGLERPGGVAERLERLDESVMLIRQLLDGERVTHAGRFYTLQDAISRPRPVQDRLPILIGGAGPKKTLRIVATRADAWNTGGTLDEARVKVANLERHMEAVGRDPASIERTLTIPMVIRDSETDARDAFDGLLAHNGLRSMPSPGLLGPPGMIADALRGYLALRFTTFVVRMPAPYDRETLERVGEVATALGDG